MQFIIDTDNQEINIISGFTRDEFVEIMNQLPQEWQDWYIDILHPTPVKETADPDQLEFQFNGTLPKCNCDPNDLAPFGKCQCDGQLEFDFSKKVD